MKNLNNLTERQQQYVSATRPVNDILFPTCGYYFIRGIRERKGDDGILHFYASVNWKLNEEDSWHDFEANRFTIQLDYLFGEFSLKPKITPQELKHQLILVKSVVVDFNKGQQKQPVRVYADWEITGFVDMFDAIPYFNLFNPLVLAADDYQYELEEVSQFAIAHDEQIEDGSEDDCAEYDENDSINDLPSKADK